MEGLNTGQLFANWLSEFSATMDSRQWLLRVQLAEPRFETRNYYARFKVYTATLDGTGQNPTDIECVVVEVSETNQAAKIAPQTACDSIPDA